MRSTAEWEAALEGTTPGPWENREYGIGPLYADIYGSVASENQKDEELAALAPEAVAEVIRLRRELEERVRIWQKVAEKLENRGDKDGAIQARHTVAVVTRILDGTHE